MSSKTVKIFILILSLLALTIPSSAQTAPSEAQISSFATTNLTSLSMIIGETSTVAIHLNNVPAEGLASAEFTCTYNSAIVEVSAITPANLFGVDPVVVVNDPQNGSFVFAIAGSVGNKATTDGAAFTFSVKGIQVGQSTIDCQVLISTGNLVLVAIPSTPASLEVIDPSVFAEGTLTGQVLASKPVTVALINSNGSDAGSIAANVDGSFSISLPAEAYTVILSAPGHLKAQGSVNITGGQVTTFQTVNLLAGDIDGNDVIDQFDALTIGINYKGTSPAAADLNNDGTINVLELEILAPNYRRSGPIAVSHVGSPVATSSPVSNATVTSTPHVHPTQTAHVHPTDTVSAHDKTQWHGIIGNDHEHGDDPSQLNALFGRLGEEWGGSGIDHPYHTYEEHNDFKHRGHKITARMGLSCIGIFGAGNCVTDLRILHHLDFFAMGTRFHSATIEARVCRVSNPSDCGTFFRGGHLDFGNLRNQSNGEAVVSIPADNTPFPVPNCGATNKRLHSPSSRFATWYGFFYGQAGCLPQAFRAGGTPLGYLQVGTIVADSWALLNLSDPLNPVITCPDGSCEFNSSSREQAHLVSGSINPALDGLDGVTDGHVTLSGFTNLYGFIDPSCSAASGTCVPFSLVNMPLGEFQHRDDFHNIPMREYDSPPAGRIKYPN